MVKDQEIKENARKKKLVEAGKTLFYKYGYRKVTVEEICKSAGISKMTFYRYFENKIDLVKFIMTEIASEGWSKYLEIKNLNIPFEEKIRATIQMKFDTTEQYSDDLLRDVYDDKDSGLMDLLQRLSSEMMIQVMEDYRIAQKEGHIRKDLNLNFIPWFLNQINNLVNDPGLLELYENNIRLAMKEIINFFFYGILVPNTEIHHEK